MLLILYKKKEIRDEKIFKNNNWEYIYEIEKIKFILIYYYSDKEPVLIDFINFYFLLNEAWRYKYHKNSSKCTQL